MWKELFWFNHSKVVSDRAPINHGHQDDPLTYWQNRLDDWRIIVIDDKQFLLTSGYRIWYIWKEV